MPIKRNWKAQFLLWLFGPVKVSRLQSFVANLSNPLIGGVGLFHLYSKYMKKGQ
jgi:hypothetical protein